jgi:hypothetical protein
LATFVSAAISVHRIQPRVRDDRDTPLLGVDGGIYKVDLGKSRSGEFFKRGLDRQIADLPVGQIGSVFARSNSLMFTVSCSMFLP